MTYGAWLRKAAGVAIHCACIFSTAAYPILPALAQGAVVTDGRTRTSVDVNGRTTDIRTQTVQGANSYNSFKQFDVNTDHTVNVYIPDGAKNSINLVHGKQTQIDGVLNSIKGGQIGGNLYILNSHGVIVGPSGKVNTGAFGAMTPTKDFMDSVLDGNGVPNAARAAQIIGAPDTIPLSPNGVIKVQGKINAVRSVDLHGGSADVSGQINAGGAGRNAIRAAVNLGGIEELGAARARVKVRSSGSTRISGKINANGSAGRQGGKIEVRAGGSVNVANGARITARGNGTNSAGGTILIYAAKEARFETNAIIDVSGGDSGDGGYIDFSAAKTVELAGGTFLAGAAAGKRGVVTIDPENIVVSANSSSNADIAILATRSVTVAANVQIEALEGADILVAAPNIELHKGAGLKTSAASGDRGDITLLAIAANLSDSAYSSKDVFLEAVGAYADSGAIADLAKIAATSYGSVERTAGIIIDGAAVSGNNVTIRAGAASEAVLFGPSLGNPNVLEAEAFDVSMLINFAQVFGLTAPIGLSMIVSIAKANATIDIKNNAIITADRELAIDADAAATSSPTFKQYANAFSFGGQSSTAGPNLGGMLAWADGVATVNVAAGVILDVGRARPAENSKLAITADTQTTLAANAEYLVTGERPLAMGVTVALGNSRATANVAEGAILRSTLNTEVTASAKTKDSFSASTKVYALREKGQEQGGGAEVIITYGDYDSHASANFGAVSDVRSDGRVAAKTLDVVAMSNVSKVSFDAEGKISDDPKHYDQQYMDANASTFGQALIAPIIGKVSDLTSGAMSKLGGFIDSLSIAGAIAIGDIDQSAEARLSRGAIVAEDITIDADVYNGRITNFAKVEGKGQKVNLGFALALPLALVSATATAAIAPSEDDGYAGPFHVDAAGAIVVDAKVNFPGPEESGFSGLAEPFKQNPKKPGSAPIENLSFLDAVWQSNLYKFLAGSNKFENAVEKLFFNSRGWATTEAKWETEEDKAKTLSMAINTTIADFDNVATSKIGSIVEINRHGGELGAIGTDQTVSVTADSSIEYLMLTGDASLKGPVSGASGSTSLGVAFGLLDISNRAVAQIESGAKVQAAGDVRVQAETEQRAVTLGFSAGWGGGDVGINGAIGVNIIEGVAKALVGSGDASVAAREGTEIKSTSGAISVIANDTMGIINLIGGVSQANNVGVSAGVAFNDIDTTAIASIDRVDVVEAATTLDVKANNDGFAVGAALSAQVKMPELKDWAKEWKDKIEKVRVGFTNVHTALFATDDYFFSKFVKAANDGGAGVGNTNSQGTGSNTSGGAGSGQTGGTNPGAKSNPLAKSISDATGKFGINVSADAVVNVLTNTVEASITGRTNASRVRAGEITVDAESALQAVAVAGSVTVKKPDAGNGAGTAGLAGSYSHNGYDENRIVARIAGIGELESGNVKVDATNNQQLWGVTAAGSGQAGSAGQETANIAGSINFNTLAGGETRAEISDTKILRKAGASQNVSVTALDDSLIVSLVGGAVYSQSSTTVGVGAAASANILETDVIARLSNTTIEDAVEVEVRADSTRTIASLALGVAAAGGSGTTTVSGALSLAYNNLAGDIVAEVVGGSIDASKLTVAAKDRAVSGAGAGDVAITTQSGNTVTAGIATAVNNLGNSARAIVKGADINVPGAISIRAELDRLAVAVAAGVAATKGQVAIKGSVAVNLVGATDGQDLGAFASIEGKDGEAAEVSGSNDSVLTVEAKDTTEVHGYAGAFAAAKGAAGIGAGIVVNKIGNAVEASIGNARIDGIGAIDVASLVDTKIIAAAASVGAADNVAISGAIIVNVFKGTSAARIGSEARIGTASEVGNVFVGASNKSTVASAAGSGAFAKGGAGIGGSVTIDVYTKTTAAAFDGIARLAGDLSVLALADDNAYGGVAAFGVGKNVGVAGAIGVVVAENTTTASVGSGASGSSSASADIYAKGNVIVDAYASTDVIRANLAGGIGQSAGVGALVAVEYLSATTTSEIGNGARVVALGQTGATQVRSGGVSYTGLDLSANTTGAENENVTDDGERLKGVVTAAGDSIKNDDSFAENSPDDIFKSQLAQKNVRGVSVTADSDARMINLGLALGISGNAGVGAGATATASTTTTTARIGAGAKVNDIADLAGKAHALQDVNVRAGSSVLSVSGSVGVGASGKVGVGAGVDISVGARDTQAIIDDGAVIKARNTVTVEARSKDTSVSIGVGVGGAGAVGVGGAVTVGVSNSTTIAAIGDNVSVDAGSVKVKADADATRFQITGSGGFSGTVGVGASVSVLVDANKTYAKIGTNSDIKARDEVVVNAVSNAAYRTFTVAAGGSGVVGVAASLAVKVLRSDTQAVIGDRTKVTVTGKNADGKSAIVSAQSTFDLLSVTGGGGVGGKVGVGAGIDIMVGRATTVARIGKGAEIEGQGDIVVEAKADKNVNSTAIALGGGLFAGVAGAINVMMFGQSLSADERAKISGNGSDQISSADAYLNDDLLQRDIFGDTLGVNADASSAGSRTQSMLSFADTSTELSTTAPDYGQTQALIDTGAKIRTRGNVEVLATDVTRIDVRSGGLGVGAVGIGMGAAVSKVRNTTVAAIGNGANLAVDGAVRVKASDGVGGRNNVLAFTGAAGGFAGNVAIAIADTEAASTARIGNGVHISRWNQTADAYDPEFRFTFTPSERLTLRGQGLTNSEIEQEEKRRTLTYHLVHEQLIGMTKGAKPDGLAISDEEFALYWAMRERGIGDGSGSLHAYDPDFVPALTNQGDGALQSEIQELAAGFARNSIAAQEQAIEAAVKSYDTAGNHGAVLPNSVDGYNVDSLYNPESSDENYQRYWAERGIARKSVVVGYDDDDKAITSTIWVAARMFPSGSYSFTYDDRDARIAAAASDKSSALTTQAAGEIGGLRQVYDRAHAALVAHFTGENGGPVYSSGNDLTEAKAKYWQDRRINASAAAVEVSAIEANAVKAEAYGGSIGGAAVGGQLALAKKGGTLVSEAGGEIEAGSLAITARQQGSSSAYAIGGNVGTFAAAGGVVAIAENDTNTTARVASNANLRVRDEVTVRASASPQVKADAMGVNVGGFYGVGVSAATTKLTNTILTEIGNGVHIAAGGNVAIEAVNGKPANADNAYARAIAGSGGLLFGASGAVGINEVTSTADARLGSGVTLEVGNLYGLDSRNATVLADATSTANIFATGIGVGFIGVGAVVAKNNVTNTARTTVGAGLGGNVSGTLKVASKSSESAKIEAISGSGGVVAGAAAVAENTIRNTTRTSFLDGATGSGISVGRLDVAALHDRATAQVKSNSVRASLVGYSGAWADTKFISDVDVLIGSGLSATATQGISIEAKNIVQKTQNGNTITAGSGGLFDMSSARSVTTLDNSVDVTISGARLAGLNSAGLAVLASNNVIIADTVNLDAGGVIAGAISESRLVNAGDGRDHAKISIGNGARLTTEHGDISLRTETKGDIDLRASSKTYGGAGGAGAKANAYYTADNNISVGGNAVLQAGKDLSLTAGSGAITADTEAYAYNKTLIPISTKPNVDTWVAANNSVTIGDADVSALRDVNVDTRGPSLHSKGYGEAEDWTKALKAIFENIWRVITGRKPKPLKETITAGSTSETNVVDLGPGAIIQAGVRNRQVLDIALENGAYVDKSETAGTPRGVTFRVEKGVNVSQGLRQEIAALQEALAIENDAGKREILRGEIETLAFQLSEQLIANGGNDLVSDVITVDDIAVDTGDVNIWTTTLTGTGQVKTSRNLEIVVDNQSSAIMRMGDLEVNSSRAGNVRLNGRAINSHQSVDVKIENAGPDSRLIAVNNRFESVDGSIVQPDLYLDGQVINRGGKIAIGSTGSLIINNDIEGRSVELLAQNAIIQRYKLGFTHVGGLPYVDGSSGSMIAGGNVFLAGEYLNINGTIQAGIPIRELSLGAELQSVIDDYDAIFALYQRYVAGEITEAQYRSQTSSYGYELVNDLIHGAEAASVVKLTSFLDQGQPIVAGYNLATREIEVQRTETGGGLVTLFGHIISTGNGQIKVTDGFGDLKIDNRINRDLVLYGLDTGQGIEGKVKIVDTAYKSAGTVDTAAILARVTEITRNENGQVVTRSGDRIEVRDADGNWQAQTNWTGESVSAETTRSSEYAPKEGQKYSWLRMTADGAPECEAVGAACTAEREIGGFFGQVLKSLGLSSSVTYESTNSLAADVPIGVSFIGADIGSIKVDSAGDILIAGDVMNTTGETSISAGGSIIRRGEATVGAANLTLLASQGMIGGDGDTGLWLDMVEGGLLRDARAANGITLTETKGSLRFDQIQAGAGDAIVSANDNLTGISGNEIGGRSVVLKSDGGSIGSAAQRVNVDTGDAAGVFSATASQNIYVAEVSNDLRIDRIRAGGVVDLVVDRNILDANTRNESAGLSDDERKQRWKEAGLIDEAADQSLDNAITALEDKRKREYDQYWQARGLRQEQVDPDGDGVFETIVTTDAYDAGYAFRFSNDERSAMLSGNVSAAAIAAMEQERTDAYHQVHERIGGPDGTANYAADYSYTVTADERAGLEEGYQWTVEELSGSINKALFSDRTDTDPFIEDPNIVAGSLKITAGGAIGEQRGVFELELGPEGTEIDETKQAQLFDALAQAERDDIIYIYENAAGQRYERIGETDAAGELVGIRVELKEDVDADISGSVDVLAKGDLFLGSEETDINVYRAQSTDGNVRLKSRQGLTNARTGADLEEAAVIGKNVVLEAATKSIGSEAKGMVVDVKGALSARAGDSIYLRQVSGDLALDFIRAGNVADIRVPLGNLLDARGDLMTNVRGRIINLDAVSIGRAGSGKGIGIGQLGGTDAILNATAHGGSIYLEGTEEDLILGIIEAEADPAGQQQIVSIDVLAGALRKGDNTGANVVANGPGMTTILKAAYGIGTGGQVLDLSVYALDIENRTGFEVRVAEADDLVLLNAINNAQGEGLEVAANGSIDIHRDGVIRTVDGAIRLIAAADLSGGDVTQGQGAGFVDAGAGSVLVRGENIRMQNAVTSQADARSVRFETLRAGHSVELARLVLGRGATVTGGNIDIGMITHTGGPELLDLAFADHGRAVERLGLGLESQFGVYFQPFAVMEADIDAAVSRTILPNVWVGRYAHITTNETTVAIDQRSPAIVKTGIQVHQKPNAPFQLDIAGSVFRTDAKLIKFDRKNLTAIMIPERPVSQFTDTVFDLTGVVSRDAARGPFETLAAQFTNELDWSAFSHPIRFAGPTSSGAGESIPWGCSASEGASIVNLVGTCQN